MHSSTLIDKNIPHRVSPVERIVYPGGVHIKPKFIEGWDVTYVYMDEQMGTIQSFDGVIHYSADWGGNSVLGNYPTPENLVGQSVDIIV